MTDRDYMQLALNLAELGCGWVNPNPMVGAVIVKENRIIGTGYHHRYGENHAERDAFANCSESAQGATIYVTLTPCCHQGKTPACTDAIIEQGISRVVIGSADPNSLVGDKSLAILRQAGIIVETGVLTAECDALNPVFFHYIQTKKPYVVMKYAMTLDGKIATVTGASKWITGEASRARVHQDRHRYAGIMVGVGTIFSDDPALTCRLPNGHNPTRIICDTTLRTPLTAQVVQTAQTVPTIIASCSDDTARIAAFEQAGCELLIVPKHQQHLDLQALMTLLGERNIDSILLEGGQTLNGSALEAGIVQRIQTYIAPKVFGGDTAKSPIGGRGIRQPSDAYQLSPPKITSLGDDILLESEVLHVHRYH
ncbi:MAG: Riboflavin biosynthesis protein RibD [Lactococcus sp.]